MGTVNVGVRAGRTVRDSLARARGKEETQRGHPWTSASPGGLFTASWEVEEKTRLRAQPNGGR